MLETQPVEQRRHIRERIGDEDRLDVVLPQEVPDVDRPRTGGRLACGDLLPDLGLRPRSGSRRPYRRAPPAAAASEPGDSPRGRGGGRRRGLPSPVRRRPRSSGSSGGPAQRSSPGRRASRPASPPSDRRACEWNGALGRPRGTGRRARSTESSFSGISITSSSGVSGSLRVVDERRRDEVEVLESRWNPAACMWPGRPRPPWRRRASGNSPAGRRASPPRSCPARPWCGSPAGRRWPPARAPRRARSRGPTWVVTRSSIPTRIRNPSRVSAELFVTRSFTPSSSCGSVPHGLVEEPEIDLALPLGPPGRSRQEQRGGGRARLAAHPVGTPLAFLVLCPAGIHPDQDK